MAFDLTVQLTGLCLLAPEPAASRLHVLMPETQGPLGEGAPPVDLTPRQLLYHQVHVPVLSFSRAYLTPDGSSGGGGNEMPVQYRLRGHFVDLSGIAGGGTNVSIPLPPGQPVAPLAYVTPELVPSGQAGPTPGPSVAARFTLPPWSTLTASNGVRWNWTGNVQDGKLTFQVTFTISGVQGDFLPWSLQPFGGGSARPGPNLYPQPAAGGGSPSIALEVSHTPLNEMPPRIPPGWTDMHFAHYYTLLDPPLPAGTPLPQYSSGTIGSFFTCLMATAPVE